jgi:hypothetical protein
MAFFGLTALGSQNEFEAVAKHLTYLNVFEDKDFETVWKRTVGDEKHCFVSKLPQMMRLLYRGKVPQNDEKLIFDAFDSMEKGGGGDGAEETVSYYTFMSVMAGLREETEKAMEAIEKGYDLKPTCEFNSTVTLHEYIRTNRKFEKNLKDKQQQPITAGQEYGWHEAELKVPTTGRKQTNITAFAAELIKAGVYY